MTELKEGILLVNKPVGKTSFSLVAATRRRLGVKKVGHAGTLDPFATGVMVLLVGREYTKLSDRFLGQDKEYRARVLLGVSTDSYDSDGVIQETSDIIPSFEEIEAAAAKFQGEIEQIPPMFSAKKINGQKLCDLARKGKTVERAPSKVRVEMELLHYEYPYLDIRVCCSKGTYIRSLAHDLGNALGCFGHLVELQRTRSGMFALSECVDGKLLDTADYDLLPHLRKMA
jgi:tRNA pseudouridine55 synthase